MRHYVLTRAAYGPEWSLEANERRLAITRAVTARLMAAQTCRDWTWLVLLDPRDPLLEERLAVFRSGGVVRPILWQPAEVAAAPWDTAKSTTTVQKIAATAYRAPWDVGPRDELILQTRIDDDDGFAPDALARIRSKRHPGRVVWMLPIGVRVWNGRETVVRHTTNAMATLQTPPGDTLGVYDYGHRRVAEVARVRLVDEQAGWLWVRHPDTISGHRQADYPIKLRTRRLFPIDWSAL